MKKNKLVAIYGVKYEPDWLVAELRENLKDLVDDFVELDCRGRTDELWIHEGDYRLWGREEARKKGAAWVLWTSPDERWEKNAHEKIRPEIDKDPLAQKIIEVSLKELFHPMWYRADGIWNEKWRQRVYPLFDRQLMKYQPIQCHAVPHEEGYETVRLDVNIYHLKMIEKENRTKRTRVFKALDPLSYYQPEIGYDYLDDEKEAVVKRIPKDREYYPQYTKKYLFEVPEVILRKYEEKNQKEQEVKDENTG